MIALEDAEILTKSKLISSIKKERMRTSFSILIKAPTNFHY